MRTGPSDLLKAIHVEHEDRGAAYGDLHREGGVHPRVHGGAAGDDLAAAAAEFGNDANDVVHLFIVHAGDEGGVPRHEEAPRGGQLSHGIALPGQTGRDRAAVVIAHDGKNEFHKII